MRACATSADESEAPPSPRESVRACACGCARLFLCKNIQFKQPAHSCLFIISARERGTHARGASAGGQLWLRPPQRERFIQLAAATSWSCSRADECTDANCCCTQTYYDCVAAVVRNAVNARPLIGRTQTRTHTTYCVAVENKTRACVRACVFIPFARSHNSSGSSRNDHVACLCLVCVCVCIPRLRFSMNRARTRRAHIFAIVNRRSSRSRVCACVCVCMSGDKLRLNCMTRCCRVERNCEQHIQAAALNQLSPHIFFVCQCRWRRRRRRRRHDSASAIYIFA